MQFNANNYYQDKIIIKTHKEAEAINNKVSVVSFRLKHQEVTHCVTLNKYKQICENNSKTLFWRLCKICIYWFKCDCSQYAIKNTLCRCLVQMYKKRKITNSVLNKVAENLRQQSHINI